MVGTPKISSLAPEYIILKTFSKIFDFLPRGWPPLGELAPGMRAIDFAHKITPKYVILKKF
jgi:hypothetical protein